MGRHGCNGAHLLFRNAELLAMTITNGGAKSIAIGDLTLVLLAHRVREAKPNALVSSPN